MNKEVIGNRLCKDCRWCFLDLDRGGYCCGHSSLVSNSLVTGQIQSYKSCDYMRSGPVIAEIPDEWSEMEKESALLMNSAQGACGPEGKLWEQKKSLWGRIKDAVL